MLGGVSRGLPPGFAAGDVFVSERSSFYGSFGGQIAVFDNSGNLLSTISNPALNAGLVSGVQLGPDNTLYVGVDTSGYGGYGGELVHLDLSGNLLGIINLPNQAYTDDYYYPFGFKVASDGTFWVPQPSTGDVIHVDNSGNLIRSYYVGGNPEDVTVRADGQVFIANGGISQVQQLDPSSGNVTTFLTDYSDPFSVTFAQAGGNGDLVVTDFSSYYGVNYYNSSTGSLDNSIATGYDMSKGEPDTTGDTFVVSYEYGYYGYDNFYKYDSNGNFVFENYVGAATSLAVLGVNGGVPTPPDTSDYYSFGMSKGQSATIDLTALAGSGATFDLENSSGQVLALPHSASTGLSINEFVAQASGTYYVHVSGSGVGYGSSVEYDVVVTKSSDFDTGPNQSLTQTQSLGKGTGVLGYAGVSSAAPKTDYYSFNTNASDVVTLTTSTPGGSSAQFINTFDPELILYGPNGAVVASDDNSAGDGRNAKITYNVGTGAGKGIYTVEVLASPLTSTPTAGEYVLTLSGNTAAMPFTVTGTSLPPEQHRGSPPGDDHGGLQQFHLSALAERLQPHRGRHCVDRIHRQQRS